MTDEPRSVADRVADVVFYGPLGLVLEHRRLLPQMARRGRRQIALTRTIGRYTVRHGQKRVAGLIEGLSGSDAAEPARDATTSTPPTPALTAGNGTVGSPTVPLTTTGPDTGDLAIPQYDSLSAIQVVPRLEGLDAGELGSIRDYEMATRARRTILAKISQLQQ